MGGECGAYGEGKVVHRVLVGKPEGKRARGGPDVGGRRIFRWSIRKWDVQVVGTGWRWLRVGRGGGHL
jgi:hypothetical protein